ncbi:MAG: type VI secretion system baseplate subunit TssE [Candidatus Binataceae bacterium]
MAGNERENDIVPSLLDRLMDDRPDMAQEPPGNRFYGVAQQKASVARDLEALLNTRQETLEEVPAEFTEVNKSLLVYGLPDFTSFNLLNPGDRTRLRRSIENAIARFEPRLQRVRVAMEVPNQNDRSLRFRIEALLRVDPAPEPVAFDTVLQLTTQQYAVRGEN